MGSESEDDYVRRMEAQREIRFFKTYDMTYEFTDKTFTKTSRLPFRSHQKDGTPFVWSRSWNHERITNEAKALELVARNTEVPIPQLLDYGTHKDGRRYLTTEFISGPCLSEFLNRVCSKPDGQKHTPTGHCKHCSDEAFSNALYFVSVTALPQLAIMTSKERGIDGFVMPPSWLSPDVQPPWKGKASWKALSLDSPGYIFQHGDLAAQNIIMDPQTLKVKAFIDFEYAGFYPPGMENWTGTLCPDAYNRRGDNIASLIMKFLAADYLESYNRWDNKEELRKLIQAGGLPNPDQIGQDSKED